ncbi:hypothetical protein BH11ACT8_BH11ACT8_19690 [soil metagenome]
MTRRVNRSLPAGLLVLTVLLLAGCAESTGPVDDGSYSSLDAGAPAALESAGVDLLATDLPPGVDADAVRVALDDAGLTATTGSREDGDGLGFDPAKIAGLLGTVGNQADASAGQEHYVVLVLADSASAVVFAADPPSIFSDPDVDTATKGYVAGRLVGYYAPSDDVDSTDSFAGVLRGLAEPTS